ncbi:MAG TPA: S8 family peptidase [Deltaproteobacteria bacterium]|nr:S8 family peptidase [Deltaproteobacteria bacterium]
MRDITIILIGCLVLVLISFPAFSAEYKSDEVIVKFKADHSMSSSMVTGDDNRAMTIAVDDAGEALQELSDNEEIEYVEPNFVIEAEDIPNDWPYLESEWDDTDIIEAWGTIDVSGPGTQVVIAVVDSGVDLDHPELAGRLIAGYDFANNDTVPEDDTGHGTKVCGILGAIGNNNVGIAGVAWNVDIAIMPLKFMKNNDGKTTGSLSDAIDAIYYAVNNGADIINASWGFYSYSASLGEAVQYARDHGVLFIASAGNKSQDNDINDHYPSNYPYDNVIAVAAMNRYGDLASFSNYGEETVDIAAPGDGLSTTIPGGYSSWVSGTSFATPFVTGVVAMVISQSPDLDYISVRNALLDTTVMDGSYTQDLLLSGGCVNAYNALQAEESFDASSKATTSPSTTQSSAPSAESGGGGGGCMIQSTKDANSALTIILLTSLIVLFQVSRARHQE